MIQQPKAKCGCVPDAGGACLEAQYWWQETQHGDPHAKKQLAKHLNAASTEVALRSRQEPSGQEE